MTNGSVTVCDIAVERHKNALQWLNLWNVLLYIFGAFLVLFLIYLIVFLIQASTINSIIGVLAIIVDGVVVRWVVSQRTDAKQSEQDAFAVIERDCPTRIQEAKTSRLLMKIS
jgi:hypothetical protein